MKEQSNYSVYEIFFEETNQVLYVGVTTTHILIRLGRHLGMQKQNGNTSLRDKLIEYWEKGLRFNIRKVKSNLTKHDALAEERRLVRKYKDNEPFFNISANPNTKYERSVSICQIDMNSCKVIKTYPSLRSTEKDGYNYPNISKVCERKVCHAHGFFWCYETEVNNFKPKIRTPNTRAVEVSDEAGNMIHHFNSMTEAAIYFEVSIQTISRYVKERKEWKVLGKPYKRTTRPVKYNKIFIFDIKGNLIEVIDNISEYCRINKIDISSAYKVINGTKPSAKGLVFKTTQI